MQDPVDEGVGPSVRARTSLQDWLTAPEPGRSTALEDWLQGPVEEHAEQEAEDAWSTSESVSGSTTAGGYREEPSPTDQASAEASATGLSLIHI